MAAVREGVRHCHLLPVEGEAEERHLDNKYDCVCVNVFVIDRERQSTYLVHKHSSGSSASSRAAHRAETITAHFT